ncbi:uncharacterized protein LOC113372793 [Ctenocephalides felis]|uniref:uncharacterized protein LOC113372793 n=1 Tax=Ctenocephalides felis TaxID=7515 RepID=UPI000E6E42A8|nr:uncharacterized protein LOC113372793 [Ctenocephalides felis]
MSYNRGRFNYRKRGFSRGGSSSSGRSTPSNESSVQSFTNSANLPEVVRRSGEQPLISVALDVIPGPYPGWKLYFPLEVYTAGSQTVKNIKANLISQEERFYITYKDVENYCGTLYI